MPDVNAELVELRAELARIRAVVMPATVDEADAAIFATSRSRDLLHGRLLNVEATALDARIAVLESERERLADLRAAAKDVFDAVRREDDAARLRAENSRAEAEIARLRLTPTSPLPAWLEDLLERREVLQLIADVRAAAPSASVIMVERAHAVRHGTSIYQSAAFRDLVRALVLDPREHFGIELDQLRARMLECAYFDDEHVARTERAIALSASQAAAVARRIGDDVRELAERVAATPRPAHVLLVILGASPTIVELKG